MSPGADDEKILFSQHQHRSIAIWKGSDPGVLNIRHHCHMQGLKLHARFRPYDILVGQYGVPHLGIVIYQLCFGDYVGTALAIRNLNFSS